MSLFQSKLRDLLISYGIIIIRLCLFKCCWIHVLTYHSAGNIIFQSFIYLNVFFARWTHVAILSCVIRVSHILILIVRRLILYEFTWYLSHIVFPWLLIYHLRLYADTWLIWFVEVLSLSWNQSFHLLRLGSNYFNASLTCSLLLLLLVNIRLMSLWGFFQVLNFIRRFISSYL
jgi:hypothetical protein